jgi:Holliday junction resolvase RusA-like endonuclease
MLAAWQVDGLPKPKGSMSARVVTRGDGSQFASTFASKGLNRPWRKLVKAAAGLAWGKDRPAVACDVILEVIFMFARPQSHHLGNERERPLRSTAPRFCQAHNRGDLSKLLRCVEDEITAAGVWVDDRQVVGFGRSTKIWADADRALFRICEAA